MRWAPTLDGRLAVLLLGNVLKTFFRAYLDTVITCFSESSSSSINGRKYLATKYGPFTLTSQTLHHFSGSLSWIVDMSTSPALLIRISSLPTAFLTSAAASETEVGFTTSSLSCTTLGTGRLASCAAFLISLSVASRLERAPRMMWDAPALAKLVAIERPMPLLAPEMKC